MIRRLVGAPVALLAVLALTACGGKGDSDPVVRWQPSDGAALNLSTSDKSGSLHQTDVLIDSGPATLRGAHLRFRADFNTPVGLEIGGTVTRVPTLIDGHDQVWDLGDLDAGSHIRFPIGMWFDVNPGLKSAKDVELTLELSSRDLSTPVESSALVVSVSQDH
jgi:hypothetical protein